MRHDAKLGLALGMLVIGFAVAFCFPRQPDQPTSEKLEAGSSAPARSSPDFLAIRAYQPHAPKPAETQAVQTTLQAAAQVTELPEQFTPILIGGEAIVVSEPLAPLAPIAPPATLFPLDASRDIAPEFHPPQQAETKPDAAPKPPVTTSFPEAPSLEKERDETYLVQPGDTLSAIAARCLGSASRYQELYEANQELLQSPNDLKIGMELKIPPRIRTNQPQIPLNIATGRSDQQLPPPEKRTRILSATPQLAEDSPERQ